MDSLLLDTLLEARRLGFFGPGSVESAVQHAQGFVSAVGTSPAGSGIIDLGSGGGLPGLVLASEFPDAMVVLVDRRQKRTDFLHRAVGRLGFEHVTVRCDDVATIVQEVERGFTSPFEVVTARGFAGPEATIRAARKLIVRGGRIVVSEPPGGDRWAPDLLAELGLVGVRQGSVSVFTPLD